MFSIIAYFIFFFAPVIIKPQRLHVVLFKNIPAYFLRLQTEIKKAINPVIFPGPDKARYMVVICIEPGEVFFISYHRQAAAYGN
jgi:hypothetical protein